jgi:hypothetical protein
LQHQRRIEEQKLCVLYDPASGAIVHTHWVTTLEGGRKVSEAEMEARTRERAATRGREAGHLHILHVDPAVHKVGASYRVEGGALVEIERLRRPGAARG